MKRSWKPLVAVAVIAGAGAFVALHRGARMQGESIWRLLTVTPVRADEGRSKHPRPITPRGPWDGSIALSEQEQRRIGLRTVAVKEQSAATTLRLAGATDYDPSTLTIVRAQFDSRADRVLVDLGNTVKKGDPLIELFSTDLADAKNVYESAVSQWTRDKKVLDYKAPLAKATTLPMKELIEVENDEAQSRLRMKLAKDKLLVYGLTEKDIETAKFEDGVQKAKFTLRSRADGIVIKRAVVKGNYYDAKDELLTIAPLDRLWVRGNVSEIDADKVQVGQDLHVVFPYASRTVPGKVEHIDQAIDPETRAARFRTSIPNPDRSLKAGMFVRVMLAIPAAPGRTVIPRGAMVSVDRLDFVFIKKTGSGRTERFERRNVLVSKETSDWVIVAAPSKDHLGLQPDEQVVTNGSLLLEQMYEDRLTIEGELSKERPLDDEAFGRPDTPISITVP
jgi:membrane fusion protein, heavy metal efflux system